MWTFGGVIVTGALSGGLVSAVLSFVIQHKRVNQEGVVGTHQIETEKWNQFQQSYETEIKLYQDLQNNEQANRCRQEYAEQLRSWRAQQEVTALAPREINAQSESTLTEEELDQLKQLLTVASHLTAGALSADDLFSRGNGYFSTGRYEEALQDYNRSLELRPDDPDTLNNRGTTLANLTRHHEALADYNRSLELRPDHPATLNNRGATLDDLGRHHEALADYNRSLEIRPNHPDTFNNRGASFGELERHAEALADLNRSLELLPNDPTTLNNRGAVYSHLGKSKEALEDFNRSLELKPANPVTTYNIACLNSIRRDFQESLEWLQKAIDLDAKYREMSQTDEDFSQLKSDPEYGPKFWELVGGNPESESEN